MLIIENVLIPVEFKKELFFCCDLSKCKGACCVSGDAGAPLESWEIDPIQDNLSIIKSFMQPHIAESIDENSIFDFDENGNFVTSLYFENECVFTNFENGIAYCAIERAYEQKLISFRKPISCFLYPIRIENKPNFQKITYHRWNICKHARVCGQDKKVKLLDFLKNPLIEKFGARWYDLLKKNLNF